MHRKSRVSSAIKYDCFKFEDSGHCIIIERHGCIVFDLKRNLGLMKSFSIAREALITLFVCSILMNIIVMNILQ